MSAGITFSGLSSGIDVDSIIQKMMSLEKQPISRLQTQAATLTQTEAVYSSLKSQLTSFSSALSDLKLASTFNTLTATTSDSDVATVTASSGASPGTFNLKVKQLAQANKIASAPQTDTTTALGLSGQFKVNDETITVDVSDSLSTIAQKINDLDTPVTASFLDGGSGKAYLTITANNTGADSLIKIEDVSGNALSGLGGLSTTLVSAQDAEFDLDQLTGLKSSSNSVTSVIPGVTLTLKEAALDGSKSATINVTRDESALKDKVTAFQTAYNSVIGYIKDNSQFDTTTYQSGPLFGDSTAEQIESQLNDIVFSDIGSGDIRNLSQLGFSLDDSGKLALDSDAFDTAVSSNPDAVAKLFSATGSSTASNMRFVGASYKSKGGEYQVNITQAATKTVASAGMAQTGSSGGGETLTFSGNLFGTKSLVLTTSGGTAQDLVDQINQDSRFKDLLVASLDGDGKLTLTSKGYGSATNFSVASDQTASSSNSGIGTGGMTVTAGLNVAGTINGEAATGSGQFLMGNDGNENTSGVQLMYTGTTTGLIGSLTVTQGLANLFDSSLTMFTDSSSGIITALTNSLDTQLTDLQDKIQSMTDGLTQKEDDLRLKFAKMEEAMSKLQSQGSQISSITSLSG